MKHRWLSVMAIFAMLLGPLPNSIMAAPLATQVVVTVPDPKHTGNAAVVKDSATEVSIPKIYLPLVANGRPAPASPYAAALSQALADCADTTLNQVCYAHGSVMLDGGASLTTPGQVASLEGVSGLTLVSPDAGHWSIALLRLATDSLTPNLGLTLLAFGNVEIRNLTLYDAAAGNGDVAPALSFSSSPVPGEDPETGGLIVYNPSDEEPLPINLNGADLTLASSAVVQAQPGVKMTVTMATGGALVNTAAGDGAVIQAQQLSVPLDSGGTAAGAPTTPTEIDDRLLEPLMPPYEDDLLTPLVPPLLVDLQEELESFVAQFDWAYEHCMQGNSRQVYRVMYFARILKKNEAHLQEGLMSLIDVQVMQCATFEITFDSTISGTSSMTSGSTHVHGEGMIVSYDMDGYLVQETSMPLTHLSYNFVVNNPICSYEYVFSDGALRHIDGYMRINRNRLDISTKVDPVQIDEHMIYKCPDLPPLEVISYAFWRNMFRDLHLSEAVDAGLAYLFTPAHWKYTGNQIMAELILDRQAAFYDGEITGETWMVMLHQPGH